MMMDDLMIDELMNYAEKKRQEEAQRRQAEALRRAGFGFQNPNQQPIFPVNQQPIFPVNQQPIFPPSTFPPRIPTFLGCFADNSNNVRVLPNKLGTNMTPATCDAAAISQGYAYFGVEFGGECWAASSPYYIQGPATNCNSPCNADGSQICGGQNSFSVYSV